MVLQTENQVIINPQTYGNLALQQIKENKKVKEQKRSMMMYEPFQRNSSSMVPDADADFDKQTDAIRVKNYFPQGHLQKNNNELIIQRNLMRNKVKKE